MPTRRTYVQPELYGVEDPGHTERKTKSDGQMDGRIGQIERAFQTDGSARRVETERRRTRLASAEP